MTSDQLLWQLWWWNVWKELMVAGCSQLEPYQFAYRHHTGTHDAINSIVYVVATPNWPECQSEQNRVRGHDRPVPERRRGASAHLRGSLFIQMNAPAATTRPSNHNQTDPHYAQCIVLFCLYTKLSNISWFQIIACKYFISRLIKLILNTQNTFKTCPLGM